MIFRSLLNYPFLLRSRLHGIGRLLIPAGLAFSAALAGAASYPATTGSQTFGYANGSQPGTGTWQDGSALSSTLAGDPPAPVASVQGQSLRLAADGIFNSIAAFKIPEIDPGQDISGFTVTFTLKLKAAGTPGNGLAVSFGAIPEGDGNGELGFSLPRGLEVAWETVVDTVSGETQGEFVVYADRKEIAAYPWTFPSSDTARQVRLQWGADGLDITYDSAVVVQDLAVPGFVPALGDRFAFTAATGETASQDIIIDTLRIITTPASSIETGGPVITEFMADNKDTFEDEDLEAGDWIELHNGSATAVSLAGWFLTDEPANPVKWPLPSMTLNARAYRMIFATGKNRTVASGTLHTNFSLSKNSGYLALVKPDQTIASQFTYGPQQEDISYGEVGSSRTAGYLETPTPGTKNVSLVAPGPPAEAVVFSHPGGIITGSPATMLTIAAPLNPGAVVRYSLSQTIPSSLSPVYNDPLEITNTTTIRARVFEPGKLPGPVQSRTFLRIDNSLINYNSSNQVFSSNLPVLLFDSFGVNVDGTTDPGSARPFRPTYAIAIAPDPVSGRARLDGPVDYQGRSATHVRGESSSGFAQKSYAWETWDENDGDLDAPVLGMPAESDWVLHGPYSDKSMMRNHLVYSTFSEARGDWFAPRTRFVEVFFNQQANQPISYSDYRGVYLLVEKIKRTSDRVNVAKINPLVTSQPTITGGYIFKKDKASLGSTNWTSSRGIPLQSSTPDAFTTPQLNYLRTYVNSFESALNGGNFADPTAGYAAWIDVDTFIDWQLAVEMTKQIDGYIFSTYFNKDRGGKMRAGPLWDFNISLGNADYAEGEYPTGWDYDASRTGPLTGQLWFTKLLTDPNYKVATFDRYWELRRGIWSNEALMARIDAVSELLRDGKDAPVTNSTSLANISPIARHFRKYPVLGGRQWPNPASATTRTTFQAEVTYLKNWITERLEWMDNQYGVVSTSLRPPMMSRTDTANGSALISLAPFAGTVPGTNFAQGQIYYTTDGSDPRPSGARLPSASNLTVLPEYGQATWLVPSETNGGRTMAMESWTGPAAPPNAAAWTTGQLGVGFETLATSSSNPFKYYLAGSHSGDTSWTGGTSNLQESMYNVSSSVFVRVPFTLTADQQARLARLQLKMRYDDGFVAYVNGVEAARLNVTEAVTPGWDSTANSTPANFTDSRGAAGETLDISHVIQHLVPGENMLAILAVNRSVTDNDFLCSPSLLGSLAVKPTGTEPGPAATAYTEPVSAGGTTVVKARLYSPVSGLWSPLASSTFVVGAQPASPANLVISEIHYAPLPPTSNELDAGAVEASDFEFIEFLNTSADTVDLANVKVSGAVDDFNFNQASAAQRVIPPGGRVILCSNPAAFQARYGNNSNIKIAGSFSGKLNNAGENITLTDKDGALIWSFAWSNSSPWPSVNDGSGASILLNNPTRQPAPDPALGSNWRAGVAHGAPGQPDSTPFTGTAGADTDTDGMPDLLEYFFGTDLASANSKASPAVVLMPGIGGAQGSVHLEIPRSPAADGINWKIEVSPNLSQWTSTTKTLVGSRIDSTGQRWERWSAADPPAFSGSTLFYRVSVELP